MSGPDSRRGGKNQARADEGNGGDDLLFANKASNRDAAPAHTITHKTPRHEATCSKTPGHALTTETVGMVAIRVCHGNGFCTSAQERFLSTAAQGRVEVLTGGHVDVRVETNVGEAGALVPVNIEIVEVVGWESDGIAVSR